MLDMSIRQHKYLECLHLFTNLREKRREKERSGRSKPLSLFLLLLT
jgi:hypothetical protein